MAVVSLPLPPPARPALFGAGVGAARRGLPDGLLHAVPERDTTRSAVCGARVKAPRLPWDPARQHSCPQCAVLLLPGDATAGPT
jgi:hypothetical protein